MKYFALLAIALLAAPAWSINKCTGPDGKVMFQDVPCAGKGATLDVRPASGHAPKAVPATTTANAYAAPAPVATTSPVNNKEGAFGESWQRRTYLENRGISDARAAVENHQRGCVAQQVALASRKRQANNSLAGATWEQSISTEMQAVATMCDSRSRELLAESNALQRELRELQAKP